VPKSREALGDTVKNGGFPGARLPDDNNVPVGGHRHDLVNVRTRDADLLTTKGQRRVRLELKDSTPREAFELL
jgi:hypothetical protein